MNYLIVQGSSYHSLFVTCKSCGVKQTWMRAYEHEPGVYETLCAKCKKTKLEGGKANAKTTDRSANN
jgi:hypothetical protein